MNKKVKFENVEVIKNGDIVSWIKQRWKRQGIKQKKINEAFGSF